MVTFDWSCAHLLAPVSSNKIQSGDIMVPVTKVHVENGRQNGEGERERDVDMLSVYVIPCVCACLKLCLQYILCSC